MQRQLIAAGVFAGAAVGALTLAVGVYVGRATAPGGSPSVAAAVKTPPADAPVIRDATATADGRPPGVSEKVWRWAEKTAREFNEQQEQNRRERLEQIYVTQALTRLTRREGGLIEFIDPPLDPDKMIKGDVGTFALIRVLQVIDEDKFLATVDDGQTVIIAGISTADIVDGREFRGRQLAFEVLGPLSYETVLGAKKTVMTVRQVDAEGARQKARDAVRAEIKRMRGE